MFYSDNSAAANSKM